MTDIQRAMIRRAMLGDHDAAARLTDAGVLIPCPFCGGEEIAVGSLWAFCDNCHSYGMLSSKHDNVVRDWNTRAPLLTPGQMEMLEGTE